MSLTLYFLRHGQTPLSRTDSFCGSGLDPELTAEGSAMAESFAETYRTLEWRGVYASPLRRTVATAQPLCTALNLEINQCAELQEIGYGQWEGLTKEEVSEKYHDDYIRWQADPAWYAPTNGESGVLIARRGLQAIEQIRQKYADGNVLIVSHKATIRIILCSLLGIDAGRFRTRLVCPVGSVSVVEFNRHGPLLLKLADRSHLSEHLRSLPGT